MSPFSRDLLKTILSYTCTVMAQRLVLYGRKSLLVYIFIPFKKRLLVIFFRSSNFLSTALKYFIHAGKSDAGGSEKLINNLKVLIDHK